MKQTKSKNLKVDWVNTLFLILSPIFAVILTWKYFSENGFHWNQIILAVIFYLYILRNTEHWITVK
jgi:hypothetical protein